MYERLGTYALFISNPQMLKTTRIRERAMVAIAKMIKRNHRDRTKVRPLGVTMEEMIVERESGTRRAATRTVNGTAKMTTTTMMTPIAVPSRKKRRKNTRSTKNMDTRKNTKNTSTGVFESFVAFPFASFSVHYHHAS